MRVKNNLSMCTLQTVKLIERVVPNIRCLRIDKQSENVRAVMFQPDLEIHLLFDEDACTLQHVRGILTMEHWASILEEQAKLFGKAL